MNEDSIIEEPSNNLFPTLVLINKKINLTKKRRKNCLEKDNQFRIEHEVLNLTQNLSDLMNNGH